MPDYLPNAEPFFFPGNRVGCLLIHGFTGTPYEMRELGERLAAQGYTVLGPVLAGHATCLADLQATRWHDWYASFEFLPHLENDLRDVRAPGLFIQSRGDRVIAPDSITQFHTRLGSIEKEMVWLKKSGHLVLEDYAKEQAFACILEFVRAHIAQGEPYGTH